MSRKSRVLQCGYCDGAAIYLHTCDICTLRCCRADIFRCPVEGCTVQICPQCRGKEAFAARRVHEEWQCAGHHEIGVQHGNMLKVSDMAKSWQPAQDTQGSYVYDHQNKLQTFGAREIQECCIALCKLGGLQNKQAPVDKGKVARLQVWARRSDHSLCVSASLQSMSADTPIRLKSEFPLPLGDSTQGSEDTCARDPLRKQPRLG